MTNRVIMTDRFINPNSPAAVFWTEVYLQNSGSEDPCISAGRADEATKAFQARLLMPGESHTGIAGRFDLARTPDNQRRAPTTDAVRKAQAIANEVLAQPPRPRLPPGWVFSAREGCQWLARSDRSDHHVRLEFVMCEDIESMVKHAWCCFKDDHYEWYAFLAAHGMVP